MAIISNFILFSQYFGIEPNVLDKLGIFDPMLNIDTKLFIDPLLLERSKYDIIKEQAANELRTFYENILSLLEESRVKGDYPYKAAVKLMPIKEVVGTCLGYGTNSISGRSIPQKTREKIIDTASEIINLGIKKPELFFILPLFEKGIGSDTISDLTTSAIQKTLLQFSVQIGIKLGIETSRYSFNGEIINIIKNPLRKKTSPILLLPQDILRKLPFATTWDEIEDAANANNDLRIKFNRYISKLWNVKTKNEKERQLALLMKNQDGINTLIEIVNKSKIMPYNFNIDEESVKFVHKTVDIIYKNPLKLTVSSYNQNDLEEIVKTIINQFKFLIEYKGINALLWKDKLSPNSEKITQNIFFLVAYNYCKANNIDINQEMDTGLGNVDFKFSRGFSKKIIVEIKHSKSNNIIRGFSTQLELYKKAEETIYGYYIIVDVGGMGKKLEKLYDMYNTDNDRKIDIIYIDGRFKPSASKRKAIDSDYEDTIDMLPDDTDDYIVIEPIEENKTDINFSDYNTINDNAFEEKE